MNLKTIRRWAPWLALVVLFSTATSLLSWWQFERREERVAKIDLVLSNYDMPPVELAEIDWLVDGDVYLTEWRQVRLTGNYRPQDALLVRNRPLTGQAGFLQLVPFELTGGQIIMVERGWLVAGNPITSPASNPLPDDSPRELLVRLRAPESDLKRADVPGQVHSINLTSLSQSFGPTLITDYYGRLVSEVPPSNPSPLLMPKPSLNEGNHLSYALQWVLFGIMAFIAFFWALNNEKRLQREARGEKVKSKKRVTQAQLDAEIEDAQ